MIIRLLVPIVLFSTIIIAQPFENVDAVMVKLTSTLGLTEKQRTLVKDIIAEQNEFAKRKSFSTNRDRIKFELSLIDKADKKIEKLLTQEQRKKFEQYKDERRREMRERMKERQN